MIGSFPRHLVASMVYRPLIAVAGRYNGFSHIMRAGIKFSRVKHEGATPLPGVEPKLNKSTDAPPTSTSIVSVDAAPPVEDAKASWVYVPR
jgi:hypothetical protein